MSTVTLQISGMSCGHCVKSVDTALKGVPGVIVDTVSVGSATISYEPATVTIEQIKDAIEEDGYDVVAVNQ